MGTAAPATADRGPPRGRRRRLLLVAGGVLLGILLLVGLAPTLVGLVFPGLVLDAFRSRINGRVEAAGVSLGWFSGIELQELRVTADREEQPAFATRRLAVDLDLAGLVLQGRLEGNASLEGTRLRVTRRRGGLNLPALIRTGVTSEAGTEPLPRTDLRLDVSDLQVTYVDLQQADTTPMVTTLHRLHARLDPEGVLHVDAELPAGLVTSGKLSLLRDGRPVALEALRGQGRLEAQAGSLADLASALGPWVRSLEGRLDMDHTLTLENGVLRLRGTTGMADLRGALRGPAGPLEAASLSMQQDLTLPLGSTRPRGTLTLEAGSITLRPRRDAPPVHVAAVKAQVTCDGDGGLQAAPVTARGERFHLEGEGAWSLGSGTGRGRLAVAGPLEHALQWALEPPALSGGLDSQVTFEARPDGTLVLAGTTRVHNLEAHGLPEEVPPLQEEAVTIRHDLVMGPEAFTARNLALETSFAHAQARGSIRPGGAGSRPSGRIELDADADLAKLGALLGRLLPVRARGRMELTASLAAREDGFDVEGGLTGTDVRLEGEAFPRGPLVLGSPSLRIQGRAGPQGRTWNLPLIAVAADSVSGRLSLVHEAGGPTTTTLQGNLHLEAGPVLEAMALETPPSLAPTGDLELHLVSRGPELKVRRLRLASNGLRTGATGTLHDLRAGAPSGKLMVTASGPLERIQGLVPDLQRHGLAGAVELTCAAELGTVSKLEAHLDVADMVLRREPGGEPLHMDLVRLRGFGRHDRGRSLLEVTALSVASPLLQAWMEGESATVQLGEPAGPRGTIPLRVQGDLAKLPPGWLDLPPSGSASGRLDATSRILLAGSRTGAEVELELRELGIADGHGTGLQGSVVLQGSLNPDATFAVEARGHELVLATPGRAPLPPMELRLDAAGRRGATKRPWMLEHLTLEGPGLKAQGTGRMGPDGASALELDADLALAAFAERCAALSGTDLRGTGAGRLSLALEHPAGAMDLRQLSGRFNLTLEHLAAGPADLRALAASGELTGGSLHVRDGEARLNGGSLKATGSCELLEGPRPAWSAGLEIRELRVEERLRPLLARVIPIFAGTGVEATALLGGEVDLSGTGFGARTLSGGGLLEVSGGSLSGGPLLRTLNTVVTLPDRVELTPFRTRFTVRQGRVRPEPLVVRTRQVELRLQGTTGLDGSLDHVLGLRPRGGGTPDWRRWVGLLDPQGFLPLPLGGTLEDPRLKPPDLSKAAGNALEGILRGGLKELLEKARKKRRDDGR